MLNVCPFEGNGFTIYGAMINVLNVVQYVFRGLNRILVQKGESDQFFEILVENRFLALFEPFYKSLRAFWTIPEGKKMGLGGVYIEKIHPSGI